MIDRKPRTLRQVPLGTKILDPFVMVNGTGSEIHVFINRKLDDDLGPKRVEIRPGEYFVFPHMNYNVYPGHKHLEGAEEAPMCHVTMLKGKNADRFLERVPKGLREAKP